MKRSRWAALTLIAATLVLLANCGGSSAPKINDTPVTQQIFPSNVTAGSDGFTMFITGTGFISGAKGVTFAYWNGSSRSTTLNVTTNQLLVQIPASDVATANNGISITVANPAPGGGPSQTSVTFRVEAAQPNGRTIASFSPTSAMAGSKSFTLTVNGDHFSAGDLVLWNGSPRTTTFMSSQMVQAHIDAIDIATPGSGSVAVSGSDQVVASPSIAFPINGPNNPKPSASSISPTSATPKGADFQLTVNGSGFAASSVVEWNSAPRATAFVSASQLVALIPAADIAAPGTANVSVTTPAPGGGTSSSVSFTIQNPKPAISSLSPSSATHGGASFTLTVVGTDFVQTSVVQWNGTALATTFLSGTELEAQVPASDIASAGSATVTVMNPMPGGGTSAGSMFTIK
ncbi:MAG TPA: IPT/TIG domain-containing protein [Candidatus Acidoferrales bacterium]|nr:IPT/TIG domain-containing protein [Candidatus Acidoferrales bacterium]